MKRLRRRLFNTVAALSLLIFLNYTFEAAVHLHTIGWQQFSIYWHLGPTIPATDDNRKSYPPSPSQHNFLLGFDWGKGVWITESGLGKVGFVNIPKWFPLLLTGLLPAVWCIVFIRNQRQERRRIFGHCTTCGYDLRATPNLCPECGTVPSLEKVL